MMKQLIARVPLRTYVLVASLILLIVVGGGIFPSALSSYNTYTVTGAATEITILALAQLLVIITGRGAIDLSVGSTVSLVSATLGIGILNGWSAPVLVITAIVVGSLAGAFNGILVSWLRVPALIATLATLYGYNALALVISGAKPVANVPVELTKMTAFTGPVPLQLLLVLVPIALFIWFALEHTVMGRQLRFTGINDSAARLVGVKLRAVDFWVFVAAGALAGVAALLLTARFSSARPDAGAGLELQAITIAVLGGVSILGGLGTVGGVLAAGLLVAYGANLLSLSNTPAEWQLGLLAALLIAGSLTDSRLATNLKQRFAAKRAAPATSEPASIPTPEKRPVP